jgi:hypothetical protein
VKLPAVGSYTFYVNEVVRIDGRVRTADGHGSIIVITNEFDKAVKVPIVFFVPYNLTVKNPASATEVESIDICKFVLSIVTAADVKMLETRFRSS